MYCKICAFDLLEGFIYFEILDCINGTIKLFYKVVQELNFWKLEAFQTLAYLREG